MNMRIEICLFAPWDNIEKRETVERETAACLHQRKARESAWNARERTGKRWREWRGSWRESKRLNETRMIMSYEA